QLVERRGGSVRRVHARRRRAARGRRRLHPARPQFQPVPRRSFLSPGEIHMRTLTSSTALGAILAAALVCIAATPVAATPPTQSQAAAQASANFERDRRAILAMAGDYRVRFDMRETVPF